MSDTDETLSAKRVEAHKAFLDATAKRVEAHKALLDAAIKAARYLEATFTPLEDEDQVHSAYDEGKQYPNLSVERANIALKLLEIAYIAYLPD
jgi:hypothetical protein